MLPRILAIALALLLTAAACGEKPPTPEEEARVIYEKAADLKAEGELLAALAEYDKLAAYEKTPAFEAAKADLLDEGFTPGSALESYTVKQLFELKNKLIEKSRKLRPNTDVTMKYPMEDAWGNFFRVHYQVKPTLSFEIISAGPDGVFDNGDDLVIDYKFKPGELRPEHEMIRRGPRPDQPDPEKKQRAKADSPAKTSSPDPKLPPPGSDGESVISVDRLLETK